MFLFYLYSVMERINRGCAGCKRVESPEDYRSPITLCRGIRTMAIYQSKLTYHFKRPNSPNPHFYSAFDALDTFQFDTLPPASPGWFSPEQ
jgi:hypothetical protein